MQSKCDDDASSSVTNKTDEVVEQINEKLIQEAIDSMIDSSAGVMDNMKNMEQKGDNKEEETRNQTENENDNDVEMTMIINEQKVQDERKDEQNDMKIDEQLPNQQGEQEQEQQQPEQSQPQEQVQQQPQLQQQFHPQTQEEQNENIEIPTEQTPPPSTTNNPQYDNDTSPTTTTNNDNNINLPSNIEPIPTLPPPTETPIIDQQPPSPYIPQLFIEDFECQNPIKDYQCKLCYGIICDPIVDTCSHGFCKLCFETYLKLNPENKITLLCPLTHQPTSIEPGCTFVKAIIEKQIKYCHYKNEGCTWKGTVKDSFIHQNTTCPRERITCSLEGCEQSTPREQMQEHISNCDYRIIQCENCKVETPFISLNQHYTTCPKYPVECPQQCNTKVQRENINEHILNECPNTKVKCPYYDMGCKCMYAKKDTELHSKDNYTNHLSYVCVNLNKKNEEFKYEIQQLHNKITALHEEINNNNNKILNKKRQRLLNEDDEDVNKQETTVNVVNSGYETPSKKRKIIDNMDIHPVKNHYNPLLPLTPMLRTQLEIEHSFFDLERIPDGIRVNGHRVASTLSTFSLLEHKFVFVNHKVSNTIQTSWKVCFIKQPQWVFIGLCDKDKVIDNKMKFFLNTSNLTHGCFGYSTNNYIWNTRNKPQNNYCISRSIKLKKNDEIRFTYNPLNKIMNILLNSFTQTLVMVEPLIAQSLTICVIFVDAGDEVEINLI